MPNTNDLHSIADDVGRLPTFVYEDATLRPFMDLCLSNSLATSTPAQLTEVITLLAPQMKNRKDNPSAFVKLDLPDFIASSGYITLTEGGERIYWTR